MDAVLTSPGRGARVVAETESQTSGVVVRGYRWTRCLCRQPSGPARTVSPGFLLTYSFGRVSGQFGEAGLRVVYRIDQRPALVDAQAADPPGLGDAESAP